MKTAIRRLPVVRDRGHAIDPPGWSGPEGAKRVLVEEDDAELRHAMAQALQRAGYRTAECSGPGHHREGTCPLVEGSGCETIDGADAVVQVLVTSDEPMHEVRAAVTGQVPDLPVVVFAPRPAVERRPDLVEGTLVDTGPLTRAGVVAAVEAAIGAP